MDDKAHLKELSAAFLKERHGLMAYIYGLLRDSHAAEDIFQELWLRLADAAEKGETIEKLPQWCRGTARNLVLHHWRDAKNAKVKADTEFLDLVEQAFGESDSAAERWQERRDALLGCIKALPGRSRLMLDLKYGQELSISDMAGKLRNTVSGVTSSLSRIRVALFECVERRLSLEAGR